MLHPGLGDDASNYETELTPYGMKLKQLTAAGRHDYADDAFSAAYRLASKTAPRIFHYPSIKQAVVEDLAEARDCAEALARSLISNPDLQDWRFARHFGPGPRM